MSSGFYLKLTDAVAEALIDQGISQLFGDKESIQKFIQYTYFVEDTSTGDKYWRVEDLIYDGYTYNIISFLNTYYPSLQQYDDEHVAPFKPVSHY